MAGLLCAVRRVRARSISAGVVFCLLLVAMSARAQEVGTIAEVQGAVEIVRSGVHTPASIGTGVQTSDAIVTGTPGGALVVFQDDSVLVVGPDSHVRIDEHVFTREPSAARSVLHLLKGKVRALVSEYYREPGAEYRIESPVGIAGVRGTEFVITYDPVAEMSDVVGVNGTVQVYSTADRALRSGVSVTPRELTTVAKGKLPTPPRYITDERFRSYLDGLEFIGNGVPESLALGTGILAGSTVPEPEQAASAVTQFAERGAPGELPFEPRGPADVTGEPLPEQIYVPQGGFGDVGVDF
jgi:hypothetical protein